MQNQHWQDWLNLILAVWLFLSPVVIGAPLGGVTIGNYCLVGIALASVENCLPAGRDGTRPYGSNERGIRVAEIFARLPARPNPLIYQCPFCSDVNRRKVSGGKCLIHCRQEPLIRAQILPFEFAKLFSKSLCCLNFGFL